MLLFLCLCTPFYLPLQDIDECVRDDVQCANGGTRQDEINDCVCLCAVGFMGKYCNMSTQCSNDTACSATGYCSQTCSPPATLPPFTTSLLDEVQRSEATIPTSFDGEKCVLVDPSNHPTPTNELTIFASVFLEDFTDGYILLKGDSPDSQAYGLRIVYEGGTAGAKIIFPVSNGSTMANSIVTRIILISSYIRKSIGDGCLFFFSFHKCRS